MTDGSNTLLWSAASSWELAVKLAPGRIALPEPLENYLPRVFRESRITPLAIEHPHAWTVATLPGDDSVVSRETGSWSMSSGARNVRSSNGRRASKTED